MLDATVLTSLSTPAEVQHAIDQFQIAQNYFFNILAIQTGIFSLIVAAIVTLYFLFNWRASKEQIRVETDAHFKELEQKINTDFSEKIEYLQNIFSGGMENHEKKITKLTGQVYRTLGQFWDSENAPSTAFIWWFRAGSTFAKNSDKKLARICLSSAKNAIEKIKHGFELSADTIGEYQKLLMDINDEYKIEKELLDIAIKATLMKK